MRIAVIATKRKLTEWLTHNVLNPYTCTHPWHCNAINSRFIEYIWADEITLLSLREKIFSCLWMNAKGQKCNELKQQQQQKTHKNTNLPSLTLWGLHIHCAEIVELRLKLKVKMFVVFTFIIPCRGFLCFLCFLNF